MQDTDVCTRSKEQNDAVTSYRSNVFTIAGSNKSQRSHLLAGLIVYKCSA